MKEPKRFFAVVGLAFLILTLLLIESFLTRYSKPKAEELFSLNKEVWMDSEGKVNEDFEVYINGPRTIICICHRKSNSISCMPTMFLQ